MAQVEANVIRTIGWLAAILAIAAIAWDYWRGPNQGGEMEFSSIAEGWAELHRDSLIGLNSFTEKNLSPEIWDAYLLPALNWNAALSFTILAIVCFFISRDSNGSRRRGMFTRNSKR